jgi:regulator of replication initiation timing
MQQSLHSAERAKASLEQQLLLSQQQLQQSQQELQHSQQQVSSLQHRLGAGAEEVEGMRQELQALQSRLGARDASLLQQLQAVQQEQREGQAALAASQQHVQHVQASHDTLCTILQSLHTSLTPSNLQSIFSAAEPHSSGLGEAGEEAGAKEQASSPPSAMQMFSMGAAAYQELGQRLSSYSTVEFDDAQMLLERCQVSDARLPCTHVLHRGAAAVLCTAPRHCTGVRLSTSPSRRS